MTDSGKRTRRDPASPLRSLTSVLVRERRAALEANIDALVTLQHEKREILEEIGPAVLEGPAFRRLGEMARVNVGLIRQLVTVQRALAGFEAPDGYGKDGKERTASPRSVVTRTIL